MKDLQYHQMSALKPHQLRLCVYFWVALGWVGLADGGLDAKRNQDALTQLLQSLSWG